MNNHYTIRLNESYGINEPSYPYEPQPSKKSLKISEKTLLRQENMLEKLDDQSKLIKPKEQKNFGVNSDPYLKTIPVLDQSNANLPPTSVSSSSFNG